MELHQQSHLVSGLGFWVQGVQFSQGLGFRVSGFGFGFGLRAQGIEGGFRVRGLALQV